MTNYQCARKALERWLERLPAEYGLYHYEIIGLVTVVLADMATWDFCELEDTDEEDDNDNQE